MSEPIAPELMHVLVEQHRRYLDFLERRVGSRATAEELLQAAYVKSIERSGGLRDGESAVAWFYRLLRNALVDFYRHRDSEQRALARHATEMSVSEEPDSELQTVVCACVNDLVPTLKPEYAQILRAVEIEGKDLTETARTLRITPGNAAVRAHRARLALKQRLEATCGTCTEHGCLDCTCRRSRDAPPA